MTDQDRLLASCKALKMLPEDTSFCGQARKRWWAFKWWFEEKIWWRFAPDWLRDAWTRWKWFYHEQISCRIWPRQKWLTDQIPRTWTDKPELLRGLLFAAIIHFVEEEDCFGTTVIEEPLATELRACYDWAKTGRAAVEKVKDDSWHPGSLKKGSFEFEGGTGSMEEYVRLEREIEETDMKHLLWIISNRTYLWV